MTVIVFEGTYNVFGPFTTKGDAEIHLKKCGFREACDRYWVNGDAWVNIKSIEPPRLP